MQQRPPLEHLKDAQEYGLDIVSALKGIQIQIKITIIRFGNCLIDF